MNVESHDRSGCSTEDLYFSKDLGRSVFITTNGCSENRMDCARMQQFFTKGGWSVTTDVGDADIILFNACGLTTMRENDSIKVLRDINTHKKMSAEVIVWGCFPKINKARLNAVHNGIIFAQDEEERLEDFFEGNIKAQDVRANFLIEPWQNHYRKPCTSANHLNNIVYIPRYIRGRIIDRVWGQAQRLVSFVDGDTCFIKASTGCLNACSYCGVRFSRGRLRSEAVHKIDEQLKKGLEDGFSKFTLIGTDLGAYGRDQGTSLVDLLNALLKHNGEYKLRLPNLNPQWLIKMLPELRDIVRTRKIEVIGCAVQSGSNRILKLMNRNHSIEEYKEMIFALKEDFPGLRVRTNIVVGFPGETELDFRKTIQLLKELNFTYADIHRYALRPGTKAAKMENQIPRAVVEARFWRMITSFTLRLLKNNFPYGTSWLEVKDGRDSLKLYKIFAKR